MFILVVLILLLVMALLIKESAWYHRWFKLVVVFYYIVITYIFITGYHRIHERYNMYDGPVIPEGWEVNSNWAFMFSFAYIIPLGILIFYVLIRKISPKKTKRWMNFILAALFSSVILFILHVIFNIAYGLRP